MLSMYIDYAIGYAVLLAAYFLTRTYAQGGFLGPYYDLIGYGFLVVLGGLVLVYIAVAPPSSTPGTATGSPKTGLMCAAGSCSSAIPWYRSSGCTRWRSREGRSTTCSASRTSP